MNRHGFSLVEMIIATFMLAVVIGIVSIYFAQQAQLQNRTQSQNEAQDKARMVINLVTQDLGMAGSSVYTNASLNAELGGVTWSGCTIRNCMTNTNGGGADSVYVRYITSLRAATAGPEACREVLYKFEGADLARGDLMCRTDFTLPLPADLPTLAENILALDVRIVCSNSNNLVGYPDSTNCPLASSYPRSAVVTVVARSNDRVRGAPSRTFTTVTGQTVTCPAGYVCAEQTQEVLMPNLKGG